MKQFAESTVTPLRATRLLLVEDNASDAFLLQSMLDQMCPGGFEQVHSTCIEAALQDVARRPFDVALLDLSLPGVSDLEGLHNLSNAMPTLPIVILTGRDDEVLALEAVKQGAQDYLVKDQVTEPLLKRAINYAIERKRFEDSLTQLANFDQLTGLANRMLFESRLEMALARSRRSGDALAVMFLDLDGFKQVNDRFGHEMGDALLKGVSDRLCGCLREYDTVARFGGDEFAILLESITRPRDCAVIARKIVESVGLPFACCGHDLSVGISIGIAPGTGALSKKDELLQQADTAMYRAKKKGGSGFQFFTTDMQHAAQARLHLEKELLHAIHQDELRIFYQPRQALDSGYIVGMEALLRWQHQTRGLLMPAEFIPVMEESGLMILLTEWFAENICRDIEGWDALHMPALQVSINVSSQQLLNSESVDHLLNTFGSHSIARGRIAIEFTEATLSHIGDRAPTILARFEEHGIPYYLDNFGSDTTSMQVLTRYPASLLKIDQKLIQGINRREHAIAMIRAMIELGHQLGMKIVAEGVETLEQRTCLIHQSCDEIQGFFLCEPLPADALAAWLSARHAQTG